MMYNRKYIKILHWADSACPVSSELFTLRRGNHREVDSGTIIVRLYGQNI